MDQAKGRRAPTIYDVAREAGVAASTVSRAFSRPGRVNAKTSQRIHEVAERLGYRTNHVARALLTGKTGLLALAVADITNPYYFGIIRGAQASSLKAGYTTLLANAQESDVLERQALERSLRLVEGIVLSSSRMPNTTIQRLAQFRPLIVLNRVVPGLLCVVADLEGGMRQAAGHLAELGHEEITFITGPKASWANGVRWQALRNECIRRGVRLHRIDSAAPTVRGGRAAIDAFRSRPTTAVIAYNDVIALGFMQRLTQIGVNVPGEVSIVGCDNIFGTDLVNPALTTVEAPLQALGATAVEKLLGLVHGDAADLDAPITTLPTRLVHRQSTAAPSGALPRK